MAYAGRAAGNKEGFPRHGRTLARAGVICNRFECELLRRVADEPVGHPAGFIEAFANLYGDFATFLSHPHTVDASQYGADIALEGIAAMDQFHRRATEHV